MFSLCLLLFQKFHNEVLILLNEVVGKAFGPQVVAKVFSPVGVKGFEDSEL